MSIWLWNYINLLPLSYFWDIHSRNYIDLLFLSYFWDIHSRNYIDLLFFPYFKITHSWDVIDLLFPFCLRHIPGITLASFSFLISKMHTHGMSLTWSFLVSKTLYSIYTSTGSPHLSWGGFHPRVSGGQACALVRCQTAPWPCAPLCVVKLHLGLVPLCVVKLMSSVWNLFLFLGNNDRALCISWCKQNRTAPWPCAPLCVVKLHLGSLTTHNAQGHKHLPCQPFPFS